MAVSMHDTFVECDSMLNWKGVWAEALQSRPFLDKLGKLFLQSLREKQLRTLPVAMLCILIPVSSLVLCTELLLLSMTETKTQLEPIVLAIAPSDSLLRSWSLLTGKDTVVLGHIVV